jgi:RNA polymerase sigma factor (sigma-70 family)
VSKAKHMANSPMKAVVTYLRRLAPAADPGEVTDGQLLESFVTHRDDAALAALIQRHGPLVWGVCRRTLSHTQDAEDAFQATWLVLVRRAKSIRQRASVRSWLYGVAYRVAVRARAGKRLREVRERQAPQRPATDPSREVIVQDLRSVLDEEINRLPAREQLPVILCYLEGKTNDEAAHLLGWPRGTIATRLARARQRLRGRLTRRGLTWSEGVLAAVGSPAAPPTAQAGATLQAALLMASARPVALGAISATIVSLTEGVLRTMFLTKLKMVAAVVVAVGLLSGGVVALTDPHLGAQPAAQQKVQASGLGAQPAAQQKAQASGLEAPPPPDGDELLPNVTTFDEKKVNALLAAAKGGDQLKALLKARLDAATIEADSRFKEFVAGRGTLDFFLASSQRLLKAELELSTQKADQLAALATHLRLLKKVHAMNQGRFVAGRINLADVKQTEFFVLEAEIALERAKAQ